MSSHGLTFPRAILFDMDGTLTEPLLDFPLIKAEMGIGSQPILEALAQMSDAERARAEAVLHRHEDHAAENAALNEGCLALLDWLAGRAIPMALITRNRRCSAARVFETFGLKMDLIIGRDDGLPFKPDPTPLLYACRQLGVEPAEAWMVGDGVFDVIAGNRAGIPTIWVSHGKERPFPDTPRHTVPTLVELHDLLRSLAGPQI